LWYWFIFQLRIAGGAGRRPPELEKGRRPGLRGLQVPYPIRVFYLKALLTYKACFEGYRVVYIRAYTC